MILNLFGDAHQWTITSKLLQYTIEPHTRVIKIDQWEYSSNMKWMINEWFESLGFWQIMNRDA